jgi:flagellar assembly protein FliH
MNTATATPTAGSVLRGVALDGEARTLKRPGSSTAAGASANATAPGLATATGSAKGAHFAPTGSLPLGTPPSSLSRQADGPGENAADAYAEGLKQGRLEGQRQGREEGFRVGYEDGLKQGRQDGLAEGRTAGEQDVKRQSLAASEAVSKRIEYLDQLLSSLPAQLNEKIVARIAAAEDDMVAMCHAVICRMLGDHALEPEVVAHSVRHAIELCCGTSGAHAALSGLLAVHVHPRDFDVLQADDALSAWLAQQGAQHGMKSLPWVADEKVRPGGCVVRSTQGDLDARLETKLAALNEILLQGSQTRPRVEEPAVVIEQEAA